MNALRQRVLASDEATIAGIEKMLATLVSTFQEWGELVDWSLGKQEPLTKQRANEIANIMLQAGYPASDTLEWAQALQRRQRRRPADKRPLAIKALELQRANPTEWTWRKLAKQVYGCSHVKACNCGELLRHEVAHVKRFLARMRIRLPEAPRK